MSETVRFSRSLYTADGVAAAAAAYARFARVTVTEEPNDFLATVEPLKNVPDLVDALCNHALHATITLMKQKAAT